MRGRAADDIDRDKRARPSVDREERTEGLCEQANILARLECSREEEWAGGT
jgi:hypothetical protein